MKSPHFTDSYYFEYSMLVLNIGQYQQNHEFHLLTKFTVYHIHARVH